MLATTLTSDLKIGSDASADFARLSGDYNPLHLDPVAARRTSYGGTVVHGIHLLLAALDRTARAWADGQREPASFSATFNNPVLTGSEVTVSLAPRVSGSEMRLTARSGERKVFAASIGLRHPSHPDRYRPDDTVCDAASPCPASFPPQVTAGEIPLHLDRPLLAALFPELARLPSPGWLADLIATTRLVGMECPGLDSIYSGLKLQAIENPNESASAAALRYRVDRIDERFRSIRMSVRGTSLAGTVDALFRAPPVDQPPLRDLVARVAPGAFAGQRALVVGGSRGLGELAAKLILAGGGEVTLTYSRGGADAARVCAEADSLARRCRAEQLDVLAEPLPEWLAKPFTHVYFFASPPIPRNATGRWDPVIFERLEAVYVRGFARLAQRILEAAPRDGRPLFLYPSTVFLAEHESGFAEYCVAKAAGEALCAQLERLHGAVFACPRLPRLRTDQTSGARNEEVGDSFAVMHELVGKLHARTEPAAGRPPAWQSRA